MNISLKDFDGSSFSKGSHGLKMILWYFVSSLFVQSSLFPFMAHKVFLLRLFGAKIGKGLVIKPGVTIKFPWKLVIGDNCWIGENVWVDNLDKIILANDVCLSQGALLLTGNHDYTVSNFPYRNAPIVIEEGVWVGAKAVVCSGVICESHSILTVGSIATKDLKAYTIYQGNPAVAIRKRTIK